MAARMSLPSQENSRTVDWRLVVCLRGWGSEGAGARAWVPRRAVRPLFAMRGVK